MKTKLLSLLAFLSIFLSCSSDDESNSINQSMLIGKWSLYAEKETANGITVFEENWFHSCTTTDDYIEFYSNGEFDWVEYQSDCSVSTSGSNVEATWSLSGSTITFGNDSELESARIESVSGTTLVLKNESSESGVNYVYYTTLQKQ